MKIKILPAKIARKVSLIVQYGYANELISGDDLFYVPKNFFGTEQDATIEDGAFLVQDWFIPPFFVEQVVE